MPSERKPAWQVRKHQHITQKTFANPIGPRHLIGRGEDLNPAAIRHAREGVPELVVVVTNQEPRTLTVGRGLPQLLGHPVHLFDEALGQVAAVSVLVKSQRGSSGYGAKLVSRYSTAYCNTSSSAVPSSSLTAISGDTPRSPYHVPDGPSHQATVVCSVALPASG